MALPQLRPAQVADWVREQLTLNPQTPPVVLDVREPWEVALASVQAEVEAWGARFVHAPLRSVPAQWAHWPGDAPMACLCHHGVRSQQAAHFLAAQGLERVVNIAGGIDAWSRDVNPSIPAY